MGQEKETDPKPSSWEHYLREKLDTEISSQSSRAGIIGRNALFSTCKEISLSEEESQA